MILGLARTGDSATIEKTREYARMKRVQTRAETLIAVILEVPGPRPVDVVVLEGTIEESTDVAEEVKAFKRAKLKDYIDRNGMPSRNDQCPCNSGRKFKKCCYLDL